MLAMMGMLRRPSSKLMRRWVLAYGSRSGVDVGVDAGVGISFVPLSDLAGPVGTGIAV